MFYYQKIKELIEKTLYSMDKDKTLIREMLIRKQFSVELPNEKNFGDVSSNVAMLYSKSFSLNPMILAERIKTKLFKENIVNKIEIIKPGFINIFFEKSFWHNQLKLVHANPKKKKNTKQKNINIEFVSANPTGLMHIGHARNAVLGDTIASILINNGNKVKKEYYINDAGNQIDLLTKTIIYHINKFLKRKNDVIYKEYYPGKYLKKISLNIYKKFPKLFEKKNNILSFEKIGDVGTHFILNDIKKDLKKIGVRHDKFVSEKELINRDKISQILNLLKKKKLTYEGFLEKPKGGDSKNWVKKKQLLFKSKEINDDIDRALLKPDGTPTYFLSDILYHKLKISKQYDTIINIWGIDHSGYVARLKNALHSIVENKLDFQIKLTALVNLIKNNKPLKMSKRDGVFISMREVVDEVGADALRFMMISRSPEKVIDFDFDLAKSKSRENPVFYVQYAFARCCSVERIALKQYKLKLNTSNLKLSELKLDEELNLIKTLSTFDRIIDQSATNFEPHRLTNYLHELAKLFHNYWSLGIINEENRVINLDRKELSKSRLFLVLAVKKVLKKGLQILNIKAPSEM